ncbi:MAG: manganese efflux pump MntP family protein [Sarcina sp.]
MGYFSIFLLGIGLAMDAFAVSLAKGMSLSKINLKISSKISITFGVFQGVMTFLGWLAGSVLVVFLHKYSFIVTLILVGIGLNMIRESMKDDDDEEENLDTISFKTLLPLAIATSIDALALGVSLAFVHVSILLSSIIIGVVTFILCFIAVILGTAIGSRINSKFAEILGGVILIVLGILAYFK